MKAPIPTEHDDVASATMQSIAEHLHLSVATVSRALRRVPGINAETRARVVQAAAQLGYRLPRSYRAEALGKSQLRHVGVLVETPNDNMPAPYLIGMTHAAMTLNASLVVHYLKPESCQSILDPEFQPRAMRSGLVSGLVFVYRWPTDVVRELSRLLPTVSISHRYPGVDIDMVGLDNDAGIDLLVRHLHGLGHRKIGFLGRCGELHWASARFGAYVTALTTLGMAYRPEWTIDADINTLTDMWSDWDKCISQVERLVRDEGVRAWVCASEPAGRHLYAWMTARGYRVPEDVSITGFHRPDVVDPSEAPLTSVTASYEAIGAAALKRLLYRIQNPAESTRAILFPSELYLGRTTASPSHVSQQVP